MAHNIVEIEVEPPIFDELLRRFDFDSDSISSASEAGDDFVCSTTLAFGHPYSKVMQNHKLSNFSVFPHPSNVPGRWRIDVSYSRFEEAACG